MRAIAVEMQQAELVLGGGVPLLRRPPVPGRRISEIGEKSVSTGVEQPQPVGRLGISGRGRRGPRNGGCGVVLTLVGIPPLLDRALRSRAKPDHGSRIASLALRITPFTTYINTDREPTLMSAVKVIPGTSLKLFGTPVNFTSLKAMRAL